MQNVVATQRLSASETAVSRTTNWAIDDGRPSAQLYPFTLFQTFAIITTAPGRSQPQSQPLCPALIGKIMYTVQLANSQLIPTTGKSYSEKNLIIYLQYNKFRNCYHKMSQFHQQKFFDEIYFCYWQQTNTDRFRCIFNETGIRGKFGAE